MNELLGEEGRKGERRKRKKRKATTEDGREGEITRDQLVRRRRCLPAPEHTEAASDGRQVRTRHAFALLLHHLPPTGTDDGENAGAPWAVRHRVSTVPRHYLSVRTISVEHQANSGLGPLSLSLTITKPTHRWPTSRLRHQTNCLRAIAWSVRPSLSI